MAIQSIFVISENFEVLPELCAGAKSLAQQVTAITFCDEATAKTAASYGADTILYCPIGEDTAPEDYAAAIAEEVKKVPNAIVMVNNSIRGRSLAGKVGVLLDTAVLSPVNALEVDGDNLVCRRMVYGGTALRKDIFTTPYGVVTVGGGVFEAGADFPVATQITQISGTPQSNLKRISRNEKKEGTVNLVAAKRIIDVGRGLAAVEDLEMCHALAKVLDAEVGCSRPVAENNKWMPKSSYMGITGVQVKPELIVVLGVSGQVQHIGGINKSKVIVAINKDKSAPIFKNADFGLVGDMYKIVPALIEQLS
ncbi:MAG: FAD-binding protein [Lachnospiraceae bacterium]